MTPRRTLIVGGISLILIIITTSLLMSSRKKSVEHASSSSASQVNQNSQGLPQLGTPTSVPTVPSTTQSVSQKPVTQGNGDAGEDAPPPGYGTSAPTEEGYATPESGLAEKFNIPTDWQTPLDAGTKALALYGTLDSTKDAQAAATFSNDILSSWRHLVTQPHRPGHTDVVQAWFSKPFGGDPTLAVITGFCRFTQDGQAPDGAIGCRTTQQQTSTGWQTVGIDFGSS